MQFEFDVKAEAFSDSTDFYDGKPGPRGHMGITGPTGLDGQEGQVGTSPKGPTGPTGVTGVFSVETGETGATGPTGFIGVKGFDGADGGDGLPGEGGDPTKAAIVKSSHGPIALNCIEAPEPFFDLFFSVVFKGQFCIFPIEPLFFEVTDGMFVASVVCNHAVAFTARLLGSSILLKSEHVLPFCFNVTLRGWRKGFRGRRFVQHSESQRVQNNSFYSRAL